MTSAGATKPEFADLDAGTLQNLPSKLEMTGNIESHLLDEAYIMVAPPRKKIGPV